MKPSRLHIRHSMMHTVQWGAFSVKMRAVRAVRVVAFSLLALTLGGCSQRPKDIIPEKKMVRIMADLQVAEAWKQSGSYYRDGHHQGESYDALGRGILTQYGVTEEEMDSTLAWYGRNMDQYAELYKNVDKELASRQKQYARAAGETAEEEAGPSSDLWPYGRHFVLSDRNFSDGFVMSITNPDIAPGDRLTWKMRAAGMGGPRDMMLGVDYEDGTSSLIRQSAHGDKWSEVSLQTDSTLAVDRIFGVVGADTGRGIVYIDSIQLLHQPMKQDEYHRINYQKNIGKTMRKVAPARAEQDSVAKDTLRAGLEHAFSRKMRPI